MAKTITNANSIFNGTYYLDPNGDPASALDGKLTVAQDGVITGTINTSGILAAQMNKISIAVNGTVLSPVVPTFGDFAIQIDNTVLASTISIGETGLVDGISCGGQIKISNKGQITKSVVLGDGADVLTNIGLISSYVEMGGGKDVFSNSGIMTGNVTGGEGDNQYKNSGTLIAIYGGTGNETASNSGIIMDVVSFGSGNDVFKNTGVVKGSIIMGEGDDTFVGGKSTDVVADDGTGSDKYSFGGGDDIFYAFDGATYVGGINIVDGGTNEKFDPRNGLFGDVYDAHFGTQQIVVNLAGIGLPSGWPKGTVLWGGLFVLDGVKGFETYIGTGVVDIFSGDKASNAFFGGEGADVLIGGGGGDWLDGGNGSDLFFYTAISESTVTLKGRDTIDNFQDGSDKIAFVDASNPTASILTSPDVIGSKAFTGDGANSEIRILSYGYNTYAIEVDVNGDGKADMAIDVHGSGAVSWSSADFQW